MAQQIVKRGSVALVRYPFTDLTVTKVRPAIIMTPDRFLPIMDDVACPFISSVIPSMLLPTDVLLEPSHPSFQGTGLKFRSVIRTHKFTVLHKSLVCRVLGKVDDAMMSIIEQKLRISLGL